MYHTGTVWLAHLKQLVHFLFSGLHISAIKIGGGRAISDEQAIWLSNMIHQPLCFVKRQTP